MKAFLLVTALLVSTILFGQSKTPTLIVKKENLKENLKEKQKMAANVRVENAFDGTFYIITDKDNPENFLTDIFITVKEARKENKDVKLPIGSRSTIVIFSERKINKENFEPIKTMIQLSK